MTVRRVESATEFLELTREHRAADPVRTNVIGAIAQGVVEGRRYDHESWFVVDDGSEVVGVAAWTLPYRLVLGPMSDENAGEVGTAAAQVGPRVPGVTGPESAAYAAARAIGGEPRLSRGERILVLRDYRVPAATPGAARLAGEADVDLVVRWLDEFAAETDTQAGETRERERAARGRTWLWVVDDEPVALAGHAPLVATPGGTVGRIGPVYTVPAERGRGYGGAVTAAVTEHLLPQVDTVMLYTDAANPISNAVYERLGFVHEHDIVELDLRSHD